MSTPCDFCRPKFSARGRRPVKPLFDGPIPDNKEYRAMVEQILEEARKVSTKTRLHDGLEYYGNGRIDGE